MFLLYVKPDFPEENKVLDGTQFDHGNKEGSFSFQPSPVVSDISIENIQDVDTNPPSPTNGVVEVNVDIIVSPQSPVNGEIEYA